ncbi:MAG: prepilin-type N-terminal cleavage/methylation domain-containing protein [Candidatus Saccharibacteria bacterium]
MKNRLAINTTCSKIKLQPGQSSRRSGFTIVEMLVVIVVIAILAAVTIVSYNGAQQKALSASLISDLSSAATKLQLYQVDNSAYPTAINSCPTPTIGNICLVASPGTSLTYTAANNTNPQTYSLTATRANGVAFVVTNSSTPKAVVAAAVPVSQSFTSSGSFTVPAGVTSVTLEVWGGVDSAGDVGGYAKGNLAVVGGDVLNATITGTTTGYDGINSYVNRPAGARLLWATGGYDTGHDLDYGDGYGYVYAGVTNTSTSGGWAGASKVVITYTPAS